MAKLTKKQKENIEKFIIEQKKESYTQGQKDVVNDFEDWILKGMKDGYTGFTTASILGTIRNYRRSLK